jgi:hypothetical protein
MLEYTEQSRKALRSNLANLISEIYNLKNCEVLGAL